MIKTIAHLYRDSLFKNSLYIMLATATLAAFGFFFWLVSARLVSAAAVGLATALVSAMNMIAVLALIGFDTALIRFLGRSKKRDEHLSTSITVVALAALLLGGLFVVLAGRIAPALGPLFADPLIALLFVSFCVAASLNVLTDAAFIAYRQTRYSFLVNFSFSTVKVFLPFAFAPWGALGIFFAAALAQTVGFFLSLWILAARFGYRPRLSISRGHLRSHWRYSLGNYVSGVLRLLPIALLPLLVLNALGAEQTAYFYIVMTIAGLLYAIPASVTNALFAEGSFDEGGVPRALAKSVRLIASLTGAAMLALFLVGPLILSFFGVSYEREGSGLLFVVTLSAVAVSASLIYGSLFRITRAISALLLVNAAYAAATLGFTLLLIRFGLFGVGVAWLLGNSLAALVSMVLYHTAVVRIFRRFVRGARAALDDLWTPVAILLETRRASLIARRSPGFIEKTVLLYPEKPKPYHVLYLLCYLLGCRITRDPRARADVIVAFEDTTIREPNTVLEALSRRQRVVNLSCSDISKERVDRVFEEVFGYSIRVDPEQHRGACVRKSNTNAVHDGKIIQCPTRPEAGYVYQKLVNNVGEDGRALDSRMPVFNSFIPFTIRRFHPLAERFTEVVDAHIVDADADFTDRELKRILEFCRRFGLDYGELDIVRDRDDGRIYIVDVNNTPAAPRPGRRISKREYRIFCQKLSEAFASEFLGGR